MLYEERFGDHRSSTSGSKWPHGGCRQVEKKNEHVAHRNGIVPDLVTAIGLDSGAISAMSYEFAMHSWILG